MLGILRGHLTFFKCFLPNNALTEVLIVHLRYVGLETLSPSAAHLLGGVDVFLETKLAACLIVAHRLAEELRHKLFFVYV